MPILSRKSEEFFCEELNQYEEDEEEEGLENEELELPINEEPEPELPLNDIFENEIPYDEEYTMFEYKILYYPIEFMTFYEFYNYLPQFYKYLSIHSTYYNRYESYRNHTRNINEIYFHNNSFYDFYTKSEESFVEYSLHR